MSHPNPSHDPKNSYPSDDYSPVRKKYHMKKKTKKGEMAKKMMKSHGKVMETLMDLVRKQNLDNYSNRGNLPPGYFDSDNGASLR